MYALENAELPLINKILSHNKVTSLNLTDSANRDFKQYLNLNKRLSDSDKSELKLRLKSMSVKEPSLMNSTLNNLSKYWKGVWEFFES
jgi:tRNA isopentenyl-2-thiomethyl-A-37 hydroxylase MiaE